MLDVVFLSPTPKSSYVTLLMFFLYRLTLVMQEIIDGEFI